MSWNNSVFSRPSDKQNRNRMETVIGAESFFQGTLRSKGSLRIDGKVEGSVSAQGVVLGETGEIQGDISARSVVVGGKITGNIHATESLEVLHKAQVYGNLHTPQLLIAEGAIFEGNCLMTSEKNNVLEVSAAQ